MLHAQAVDLDLLGAAGRATGRVALIAERIDVSQTTEIEVMKSWLSTRDEEIPGADEHATEHGPDGELIPGMVGQQ